MSKWLIDASKKMRIDDSFTDCDVIVGTTKFKCHKLILAHSSEFFKRMLLGDFKESVSGQIHLEDVTWQTFQKFRDYLYTYDKCDLDEHNTQAIIELFECGNRWLVPSILDDCLKILIERAQSMKVEELIDLFELGHNFDNKSLIKEVTSLITTKYNKQLFCDKALHISSNVFGKYIGISTKFRTEIERYEMILRYLKLNGFIEDDADSTNNTEECQNKKMEINDTESERDHKSVENQDAKLKYINELFSLIQFTKMSGEEFYAGPGKSTFLTLEIKYELLYIIQCRRINRLKTLLNQYRAM